MDAKIGRRHSLKVVGFGFLGAAGLVSLAACGKKEPAGGAEDTGTPEKAPAAQAPAEQAPAEQAPAEPVAAAGGEGCDATIDAASTQMRTSLQYKEVSDQEGKQCANCAQFKPAEYGDCGGCNLFAGPVQNNGYCLGWAAKEG